MTTAPVLDPAATAAEVAERLAQASWGDRGSTELLSAAVELGRLRAVVDGALVAVAERLEETGAADAVGWGGPA